jgi:hypothetical protein
MPAYDASGFQKSALLTPGLPGYSFGSFDDHQPLAKFLINQVQIATNVATITGVLVEGNIPAVGQLISVRYTQTGAGEFNVSNVAISAVSIASATGIGTISYSLTGSNVGPVADAGVALIQVAEQSETLSATGAGRQFAVPTVFPQAGQARGGITWSTALTGVTGIAVALEGAEKDIASQYKAIDSSTATAGETRFVEAPVSVNFLRINVTSVTGTGTIIAKTMI